MTNGTQRGLDIYLELSSRALMRLREMKGRAGCGHECEVIWMAYRTSEMIIQSIIREGFECLLVSQSENTATEFRYLEAFCVTDHCRCAEMHPVIELATAGLAVHPLSVAERVVENSKIILAQYSVASIERMKALKDDLAEYGVYTNIPQIIQVSIQSLDAMYYYLDRGMPLRLLRGDKARDIFIDRRAA